MLSRTSILARLGGVSARAFSTGSSLPKVCVVGAAGGIGQPMSLLLKNSPHVGHLSLYDVVNTPGVAADLSHISTVGSVSGHTGDAEIGDALKDCNVVVVPAGVPRKPGMTRDDLFNTNASIVASVAEQVATHCPDAFLLIISNPVNSTVPICAEVLKRKGVYNPKKLFGVTTLDVTRAETFVSENQGWNVNDTSVTVVGGHAGTTIMPLLSQISGASFSEDDLDALTHRIQFGGDEVVQAKDGAGSATLSMAYAGARFTERLLQAVAGEKNVVECCFVESSVAPEVPFFSSPVSLGPDGVEEIHGLGDLSEREQANYDEMIGNLKGQIEKGVAFVENN